MVCNLPNFYLINAGGFPLLSRCYSCQDRIKKPATMAGNKSTNTNYWSLQRCWIVTNETGTFLGSFSLIGNNGGGSLGGIGACKSLLLLISPIALPAKRAFWQKMKASFFGLLRFRLKRGLLNTSISNGETKVTFQMPAFQAVITVLSFPVAVAFFVSNSRLIVV